MTVLMRYTLRLLTLDQLCPRRGARLRARAERQENRQKSWAPGRSRSASGSARPRRPTTWARRATRSAWSRKVLDYKQGRTDRPPSRSRSAPGAGTSFIAGLLSPCIPTRTMPQELRISCIGDDCDFTGDDRLPILMVDEPIYRRLPGFLIATVDKFAAMPWKGEVAKLFGRVNSYQRGVGFYGDCDERDGHRAR